MSSYGDLFFSKKVNVSDTLKTATLKTAKFYITQISYPPAAADPGEQGEMRYAYDDSTGTWHLYICVHPLDALNKWQQVTLQNVTGGT